MLAAWLRLPRRVASLSASLSGTRLRAGHPQLPRERADGAAGGVGLLRHHRRRLHAVRPRPLLAAPLAFHRA